MKLIHLLFIGVILCFSAVAQNPHCYTTEVYTKLIKEHPEVLQARAELEQFTQQFNQAQQRNTGTVYIIPVVFHIIHNYGVENISDEQVLDAVNILNIDFRKLNSDTMTIVNPFKSVAADCNVEFRLANIDPNGKCTNGIDRIVSTKTYDADDDSKLNPWPTNKYLNIWVVNSLANQEAAAYAYYPGTAPFGKDGVIAIHRYVGSIGTGYVGTSRALTHEVGHYFNLSHPWGDTNSPGVSCGDDGVNDTPITEGWTTCNLNGLSCGNTVDNVQNYMEYSYCCNMFTNGQRTRMLAALNANTNGSQRNNLWSSTNANATGINTIVRTACAPKADFVSSSSSICTSKYVQFTDMSWNGQPTIWKWRFTGGTPATSADSMPLITYNTAGDFSATLTVSNAKGTDSVTKTSIIHVSGGAYLSAPYAEGFETNSFPGFDAYIVNPDNGNTWVRSTAAGATGTASAMIKNFGFTNGQADEYVLPAFNLTHLSQPSLTFKVANAQRYSGSDDYLKVYVSDNCGMTWLQKYSKHGSTLATAGVVGANFVPNSSQWRTETVSLLLYAGKPNVRIKFVNVNGAGNNTYVDDININGVVGLTEAEMAAGNFEVYPNPSHGESTIRFELAEKSKAKIQVLDLTGRLVTVLADAALTAGMHQYTLATDNLAKGLYLVEVEINGSRAVKKLIVD